MLADLIVPETLKVCTITFEIILKKGKDYIALRRNSNPGHEPPPKIDKYPGGVLFFCHDLIRYGETIEDCVKRIVKNNSGVNVVKFRVVDIETTVMYEFGGKAIQQWAITPHIIAEVDNIPKTGIYGNEIKEVVKFTKNKIPEDFAWWSEKSLKEFLEKFD